MSSYDVRIHAILTNELSGKRKSCTIRWKVAGKPFRNTYATRALAERFRSKPMVAQREGQHLNSRLERIGAIAGNRWKTGS